ncbi:MAG TPA: two-component system response regulator [Elusimicrobia bacterium]|nr:two-component system response regulator [Elusimicrobiota bacterium]HBT62641.1 two-component system response regulator [Elusimicrobiota bacterium]
MPGTILVVDDELGYREMLQMDLSCRGFRVLTASDGREGLAILERERVDLVITDMKMPKMDGLDFVVALQRMHPEIPVVLMTGYAVEDRVQEALAIKAKTCLRKPFQIAELEAAVGAIL